MNKKLLEKISNSKVISFDIFDTLITRYFNKPSDIFDLVENIYNKKNNAKLKGFRKKRIDAELKSRRECLNEEVTLNDIYNRIDLPQSIKMSLMKIEKNCEINICKKNNNISEILEKCISLKKRIIITSDIYLDEDTITKILKKNNIKYDKLYLSSSIKYTKWSGKLFNIILKNENLKSNQLLHIGDNKRSDYIMPKKLGINAHLFINKKKSQLNHCKYSKDTNIILFKYLTNFIAQNINPNKSYYWKIGYETFGPLLFGYVNWLNEKFKIQNPQKIYFLSRDGDIMRKAYNLVSDTNTEYLYASRRALTVPIIHMYDNFNDLLNEILLADSSEIKLESLIKKMGLMPQNYKNKLENYNYHLEDYLKKKNMLNEGLPFINELLSDSKEVSKKEFSYMKKYYKHIDFTGNIAIVDIGWNGVMQRCLEKFTTSLKSNTTITGYYTGILPTSKNQDEYKMNGFLFDKYRPELFLKKNYFNAIYELIFSTNHGSVKKYSNNKENIELSAFEYEGKKTWDYVDEIQQGALQFIKDFKCNYILEGFDFDEHISINNMLEFGNNPTLEDIKMFENFEFYDYEIVKLVESKSKLYYLIHPSTFVQDFKLSLWKSAFLKKVSGLNLNYYNIINLIRNFYNRANK